MSRYYRDQPKPPIKSSKILHSLSVARPGLAKLQGKGKPYDPLIEVILTIGPDDKTPASKTLQEQLGITAGKLRKWLEDLHQDFIEAISADADVLQYTNVEHMLHVRGQRENVSFLCRLPIVPRIGEGIELWFLMGETGEGAYYVEDVRYELSDDKMLVSVSVRPGYFDAYFWQLRARAKFEGKLPYELEDEMGEYRTRDYLRKLYAPPPAPKAYVPAPVTTTPKRRERWG